MKNDNYFKELAAYSRIFLDSLPIEKTPQPLDYAVGLLYNKVKELKSIEVEKLRYLWNDNAANVTINNTECIGLNTIGMLTDRFTILLIKEW